jgi:glycosyltransferase involved in cell wall biosynthesis
MNNRIPLVSVIMNCWNGEKYLREAIDSVYAQTYAGWEIIFWDNCSTDRSPEIATGYDGRLRYFRGEKHVSLGQARNFAFSKALGTYLAFLDCDDIWLPSKLEKQVAVMRQQPDIDFLYGNFFRVIMSDPEKRVLGLKGGQPEGMVFERFLFGYPVNLQTVMLRKSAIDAQEFRFDNALNLSEEFDFFMRILTASRAKYIPEPLALYRVHPAMASVVQGEEYPRETAYVMRKLRALFPALAEHYSRAFTFFEAKISYWRARAAMNNGNAAEARKALAVHKFISPVFFALYCLTFLPPSLWMSLHQRKMRGWM